MDTERWRRVCVLFDQLADTPREGWDARLDELCPDDADLRREVRELLDADVVAAAATDLGDRARSAAAEMAAHSDSAWSERLAGERVGPYVLVRELGRGGMGAVWLAHRADGQFEQQVAIKLIRPGWDTAGLLERFRAERQILAGLTHPNIAHLLDGGVTPDGKPWLALEYVDGVNLREHCDAQRLDLPQRMRLFLTVCDAVAHAHTRLVVHRDLKPSNLLVAGGEQGPGQVKLLDFGIAKLVDPQVKDVSALRVFTPEYAAPEQVKGELITTSVDVYALGLLLYELLTGRRPYRAENSTPAAYERAILDQEPTRPSHAVTRPQAARDGETAGADLAIPADDEALTAAELASLRQTTPEHLKRTLRGDLDAIVLKALRKEPEQRYASVADLAADVLNHLERRPVLARRGGWRYRAQRFVRRHALAASLAAFAFVALAGGLGAALWQADEARRQRDVARDESSKSAEMLQFLLELFRASDPAEAQRNDVTAREILERGVERVRHQLAAQPAARAELMHGMADAYYGIGLPRESEPLMREALEIRRALGEPEPLARTLIDLSQLVRTVDRDAAFQALDEADALLAGGTADWRAARDTRLLQARSWFMRGVVLLNADGSDIAKEAERLLRAAAAVQRELLGPAHGETRDTLVALARVLGQQERFEESQQTLDELISALRATQPLPKNDLAEALGARGRTFWRQKRYVEYEQAAREAVAMAEAAHGPGAWGVMISRHNLATALFYVGRHSEAVVESTRAIARARQLLPDNHPFLLAALKRLGDIEAALGHWPEATAAYAEALVQHRAGDAAKPGSQGDAVEQLEARLEAVRKNAVPEAVAANLQPAPS